MAMPIGPTMAGGQQTVTVGRYSVLFLPDANNRALVSDGEAPVYYWVPSAMRIARREGDTGDYLFQLLRFAGGAAGEPEKEAVGGLLNLTVTAKIPNKEMEEAQKKVAAANTDTSNAYWNNKGRTPRFAPVIVLSNTVSLSNVGPTARGFPILVKQRDGTLKVKLMGAPPPTKGDKLRRSSPRRSGDIGPWYWVLQGGGPGSIDPAAEHAFAALLGKYPANILYKAFKEGSSAPLYAMSSMKLKVWTPKISLKITGNWRRIYNSFSAAVDHKGPWHHVDLKAHLDKLVTDGDVKVTLVVDSTFPGGPEVEEALRKRTDLVLTKFMEQAQKVIFEPQTPQEGAAEASSSSSLFASPWGVSFALKWRRTETDLDLKYEETNLFAYSQDHTISTTLEGMLQDMGTDGAGEKKYFPVVYLDDWPQKLARQCVPIAAWTMGAVEFLSVQIGYPDEKGALMWEGHQFLAPKPNEKLTNWTYRVYQKRKEDVENPPPQWEPDRTFVKRQVHFAEPDPYDAYRRVQLEQPTLDLDPGQHGSPIDLETVEVRAETRKILAVGPIFLDRELSEQETLEAVFELADRDGKPLPDKPQSRFLWRFKDQGKDRFWLVCPTDNPYFRYKVKITERKTSWEGPWIGTSGSGAFFVVVPEKKERGTPDDSTPEE
ncbi:hypothetical protein LX15_001077 [Streptoalloteichus tenebrarius]|uniref:Uncharacterized protein n=1 Tax=Streptoalloteichus tenebrarius (strain ATCC 17920 / DSM 40477 / JCM 4838 / CBS 697.72 / NBRC 16177 / NCIMB 11028 / NRRL B-12390 / A12253. 1 / ISP 5477) TaxID=1933 RepID=A0ABT1HPG3_STRSD|nr:hypothetical protein [Streptoalloteichus tenebrarius]MCP2257392.1 hypothetical protein [Streptoalloteichus tenebrarius]BFE98338.1 hypothetical protein GCM10020241_00140 [Streptoalloteichus tenebrarius]